MSDKSLTLIIARHGNTFAPGEPPRRVGGLTDLPLVESGEAQAHKLASWLKAHNLHPQSIFAGPLKRTQRMAEIVKQDLELDTKIQTQSFLRELDYGPDENQPEDAVKARIGEQALKDWETHAVVPDGWIVNPDQLQKDWVQFAKTLENNPDHSPSLVVTSNGIARFTHILTGDMAASGTEHGLKLATGALSVFRKEPGSVSWQLIHWNLRPE